MKKIVLFFAVLIWMCGSTALCTAVLGADVLAHASADNCWYAKVGKPPFAQFENNAAAEQTEIYVRQNGPGQQWRLLRILPNRVIAMATDSSQLAVLTSDGEWCTVSSESAPSGQPLPAKGILKTLGDDGTDLWAIGSVDGGIAAANQSIADDPATQPSTMPAYTPPAATRPSQVGIQPVSEPRLVLFRMQVGRWATVAELPGKNFSENELSLVVVHNVPMVAFKALDQKIQIIRCDENHHWEDVLSPATPEKQPIKNFALFSDGYDPYYWQTTGSFPGEVLVNVSGTSKPLKLDWGNNDALTGTPAATFAGGFICVFGPRAAPAQDAGGALKVLEQRYDRAGKPFETASVLIAATGSSERFPAYLQIVILCMMGFSVGASAYQQWNQAEKPAVLTTLVPAQLFPRLMAGLIDLLPVFIAIAVILTTTSASDDLEQLPSVKGMLIFAGGVLIYLLHTTLIEVRTGRSIGKSLMGLKVVTVEGQTPNQSQLMIRNLLRVVDPLVMILVSPLRQRSADTVVGTVVIEIDSQAELDPLDDAVNTIIPSEPATDASESERVE
jgi:uncharacterized RDD family membrane protein YckC